MLLVGLGLGWICFGFDLNWVRFDLVWVGFALGWVLFGLGLHFVGFGSVCVGFGLGWVRFGFAVGLILFGFGLLWVVFGLARVCFGLGLGSLKSSLLWSGQRWSEVTCWVCSNRCNFNSSCTNINVVTGEGQYIYAGRCLYTFAAWGGA